MLAKAATSLDRLTGGRVELGGGAGAFREGIAGTGGPRRRPAEAVEAMEEALGILRRALAADGPVVSRVGTTTCAATGQGLHPLTRCASG
jgi:alkanesulfonate monooxygenase SsuD/methylene tetrahydromethanopterin reductase-like flavin-dependent oxidoreductase (luciferase family)